MPPTMHNKTAMIRTHPGRPMALAKYPIRTPPIRPSARASRDFAMGHLLPDETVHLSVSQSAQFSFKEAFGASVLRLGDVFCGVNLEPQEARSEAAAGYSPR